MLGLTFTAVGFYKPSASQVNYKDQFYSFSPTEP